MTNAAPSMAADAAAVISAAQAMTPLDLARELRAFSRTWGTLPPPLARMRREAIQRLIADDRGPTWISRHVGLTPSRISQLTRPARTAAQSPPAGAAPEAAGRRAHHPAPTTEGAAA